MTGRTGTPGSDYAGQCRARQQGLRGQEAAESLQPPPTPGPAPVSSPDTSTSVSPTRCKMATGSMPIPIKQASQTAGLDATTNPVTRATGQRREKDD